MVYFEGYITDKYSPKAFFMLYSGNYIDFMKNFTRIKILRCPGNIYLFKENDRNTRKSVKYVHS